MSEQIEDAWKEYERTGEICNSAEGLLTHCAAQAEHLRLKEEECKQLDGLNNAYEKANKNLKYDLDKSEQDKAELIELLEESRNIVDELNVGYNADIKASIYIGKVRAAMEKHKCD